MLNPHPLIVVLTLSQTLLAAVHIDPNFRANLSNGAVNAISVAADGTILAGGDFQTANGEPASGLARFASNGALDGGFSNSGTDAPVHAVAKDVIAGRFSKVGGISAPNIARLLASGEVDGSFEIGSGPVGAVHCLAVDGKGRTVLGGAFADIDGTSNLYLARLSPSGALDGSFSSCLKPSFAMEAGVSALAVQSDGKLLVGGNFETVRGFEYLIRVNEDGSLDETFNGNHGSILYPKSILPLPNGQIIVAGQSLDGKGFVRRLKPDRSVDVSFVGPEFSGPVHTVVMLSGKIVAGGAFHSPNPGVVRLNENGSVDSGWNVAIEGIVNVFSLDAEGQLLAGGAFDRGLVRIVDAKLNSYATNENIFRANLRGETGRTYLIEVSSDLAAWTAFGTATATESGVEVVDPAGKVKSKRFFRARLVQ